MNLRDLQKNWHLMGVEDPLWAVATAPEYRGRRWDPDAFFATGRDDVANLVAKAGAIGHGPFQAVLDFGCGVGRLSQALALHSTHVVGVDIAPSMLDEARKYDKSGGRVEYLLNERPDLHCFGDGVFDLVYSEIVLMHMEPQYAISYIREFFRVTKPGGLVIFQLPEPTLKQRIRSGIPGPLLKRLVDIRTRVSPRMEIYGVRRRRIEDVVVRAGGRVVDVESWRGSGRRDHRYWVES